MVHSLIFASRLPLTFWGDAVEYAAYILDRSPTSANAKRASPIEVLTKQVPDLRDIVAFGSICSVYRDPGKNSLAQRAQVGVIIGRSDETKSFRVFLQKENKVTITQHVRNVETLSSEQNGQLQRALEYEDRIMEPAATAITSKESPASYDAASLTIRIGKEKSKSWTRAAHRTRGATKRAQATGDQEEPAGDDSVVAQVYECDPKNYDEALRSTKREGWEESMREELQALEDNGVWRLIKRPPGSNTLHTKWAFKTKTDAHGEIERLKARLVTLAHAATWGVPAKHGDIPNAYVKAGKEQQLDILLQMPRAMTIDQDVLKMVGAVTKKGVVLQLRKSLYGLKQAGRLWSQLPAGSAARSRLASGNAFPTCVYTTKSRVGSWSSWASTSTAYFLPARTLQPSTDSLSSSAARRSRTSTEAIGELVRENGLEDASLTKALIGSDCYDVLSDDSTLLTVTTMHEEPPITTFQSIVGSLLWIACCPQADLPSPCIRRCVSLISRNSTT
uniref:Retroviral polymerase SH3-like domain-containing protein n=1 Tax=Peronospora matthiolae TaxID=2874970 RepID=A0AAV1UY47_9STRA